MRRFYRVNGNSMAPTLVHGSIVELIGNQYEENDLVMASFQNKMIVKRLVGDRLISDGQGLSIELSEVKGIVGKLQVIDSLPEDCSIEGPIFGLDFALGTPNTTLASICWDGTQFVGISKTSPIQIYKSPDGLNWTLIGNTAVYSGGTAKILSNGNSYVIMIDGRTGRSGCCGPVDYFYVYSAHSITGPFTNTLSFTDSTANPIIWKVENGKYFVSWGWSIFSQQNRYSSDGFTWSGIWGSTWLMDIIWDGAKYVLITWEGTGANNAYASGPRVYTSTNLSSWTMVCDQRYSTIIQFQETGTLLYGNGVYSIEGYYNNGTTATTGVYSSTNLASWSFSAVSGSGTTNYENIGNASFAPGVNKYFCNGYSTSGNWCTWYSTNRMYWYIFNATVTKNEEIAIGTNRVLMQMADNSIYYAVLITVPNMRVNIGGSWKNAADVQVNIGGVWKKVNGVWENINGTWKKS